MKRVESLLVIIQNHYIYTYHTQYLHFHCYDYSTAAVGIVRVAAMQPTRSPPFFGNGDFQENLPFDFDTHHADSTTVFPYNTA